MWSFVRGCVSAITCAVVSVVVGRGPTRVYWNSLGTRNVKKRLTEGAASRGSSVFRSLHSQTTAGAPPAPRLYSSPTSLRDENMLRLASAFGG